MAAAARCDRKVPVTVLTGFLGAGKTTLMNHILRSPDHGMRFAIIENEFGAVNIDEKLLATQSHKADCSHDEIVEVMNGCICCHVRGDLVESLKRLYARVKDFDAVLIETTGMADPSPVVQTFFVDDDIQRMFFLDGVITVCDAKHLEFHLDEEKREGTVNESVEQIAFADRIILNKLDLLSGATAQTAPSEHECGEAAISSQVEGADFTSLSADPEVREKLAHLEGRIKRINKTAQVIYSCRSEVDPKQLLNLNAFSLDRVLEMDPTFLEGDKKPMHDKAVSSAAFSFPGLELNVNRLNRWIGETICGELGADLYRYKGVLAVKGMRKKFVFQGVHMLFRGDFIDEEFAEDGSDRECRFVFIGKYLRKRHEELERGFLECQAEKELRFKVGDIVMARRQYGFEMAKVLKQWDEGNCYRLELQDEERCNIWGPVDLDVVVRGRTKEEVAMHLRGEGICMPKLPPC